jgi:hypothetical protein
MFAQLTMSGRRAAAKHASSRRRPGRIAPVVYILSSSADLIRTAVTELLGIDHPVVCAGMGAGATGGELAGHVSEAGGLG